MRFVLFSVFAAISIGQVGADEADVIARLENSLAKPENLGLTRDKTDGTVREIRVNAPNLTNEDIAVFLEFPKLERLTISHAGYGPEGKTGVDFSGVAVLKDHPSLQFFSAGGAVGKEYLAALPALTNVDELYIQTTSSLDPDWAPIGAMDHLTYLGIRVRNDRMSKLTSAMFEQLMGLNGLKRFMLSEMTFGEKGGGPEPFVKFVTTRPNLKELIVRRSNLPDAALAEIHAAMPELKITIQD